MSKEKYGILEDRMTHRRSLLFAILISAFLCAAVSADEKAINWFTNEFPELSAQWGYSFPFRKDLRNPSPAEDFMVAADFGELRLDTGLKYEADQFDFTNNIFYMPTFFKTFQAGLGFTWHYYRYIDCFTENDLVLSTRFRLIKGPVFTFENAIGFIFKFASIDAIRQYKPVIFNVSYHWYLLCNWKLTQKTNLWCALNLQDYYDYPLAISPFFKFGMNYELTPGIITGADYTLKYIDMFFSAVYLNESVLRFTFKVAL